ncbi:MAG: hypothetical protein JW841_08860 [Deltaproteobacteria bacterium]|nr:hypothetical protein [Deltaproteobacteria bacterium]
MSAPHPIDGSSNIGTQGSANVVDYAIRALYMADPATIDNAFDSFNTWSPLEKERLQKLLEERNLVLSPEAKDAINYGRIEEIKHLLRRAIIEQTQEKTLEFVNDRETEFKTEPQQTLTRDQGDLPQIKKAPDSSTPTVRLPIDSNEEISAGANLFASEIPTEIPETDVVTYQSYQAPPNFTGKKTAVLTDQKTLETTVSNIKEPLTILEAEVIEKPSPSIKTPATNAPTSKTTNDAKTLEKNIKPQPNFTSSSKTNVDVAKTQPQLNLIPLTPCIDPAILARVRKELLALVTVLKHSSSQPNKAKLPLKDKKALLGQSVATYQYIKEFPADGRSKIAASLPLMQFAPDGLRKTLEGLGIINLADFLVRGMLITGRRILAPLLDIPTATLLLAMYRAELLDLPLKPGQATPHPKDLILLAHLGIVCTDDLALLAQIINDSPEQLQLLQKLFALVQKNYPQFVGRQLISRHDLKNWAQAAQKRNSDIELPKPTKDITLDSDSCLEAVLGWHLQQRYPNKQALWDTIVFCCISLLKNKDANVDFDLQRQVLAYGSDDLHAAIADLDKEKNIEQERLDLQRLDATRQEVIREQQLFYAAQREMNERLAQLHPHGWSLLTNLQPQIAAHSTRKGRVSFWLEPMADTKGARLPGETGRLPAALNPIYVSINPDSGAIEPVT